MGNFTSIGPIALAHDVSISATAFPDSGCVSVNVVSVNTSQSLHLSADEIAAFLAMLTEAVAAVGHRGGRQ